MSDNLVIGGATFTGVTGIKATDTNDNVVTFTSADSDYIDKMFRGVRIPSIEHEVTTGTNLYINNVPPVTDIHVTGTVTSIPNNTAFSVNINGVVDLPTITKIGISSWATANIAAKVIYVPNATTVGQNFFQGANKSSLVKMVIGASPFTGSDSLRGTTALKALVIPTNTLQTSSKPTAMANSGVGQNADCYIYVPRSLVDSYKAATNWSVYADKIRAIEDYPLINAPTTWVPTEETE